MKLQNNNDIRTTPLTLTDVLDMIATVIAFGVIMLLGIFFLAITGCSSKGMNIEPPLTPTEVHQSNDKILVTTQATSRNVSMAITKAKHMARVQLADYLNTSYLTNSRVVRQNISTDSSGIIYIATVQMEVK